MMPACRYIYLVLQKVYIYSSFIVYQCMYLIVAAHATAWCLLIEYIKVFFTPSLIQTIFYSLQLMGTFLHYYCLTIAIFKCSFTYPVIFRVTARHLLPQSLYLDQPKLPHRLVCLWAAGIRPAIPRCRKFALPPALLPSCYVCL